MTKRLIAVVIGIGLLGGLGWHIHQKGSATRGLRGQRPTPPVAVEVAPVERATVREIGSFSGTLYAFSEFVLAPKIAGRIEKIHVHMGDGVQSGQLVAELDDGEYLQQVVQAKAELDVARANLLERKSSLENAEKEYERTATLREKKIASESQLDAARAELTIQQAKLKVAAAQVSQKEAALKTANLQLSYAQIRVPENGGARFRVVGERFVDEGALLAPNTPIVRVLDIGNLTAAIHVVERDYARIRSGLTAVVSTDAFPGRSFTGKVKRIAPLLKEASRQARVEIEVPNGERLLKPGMFVRVAIGFDEHENATVVPTSALVKRNGTQGVFVADTKDKKARFLPVTSGIVDGDKTQVLQPELTGQVVTLGHHLLEDGGSILLPGGKAAGAPSPKDTGTPSTHDGRPAPRTGA